MSYTLNKLQAAKRALENCNYNIALKHIDDLVNRMETIIRERENFKPRCKMTKGINDVDNGSTANRPEESPGEL